MSNTPKVIDLFSGVGGLSLGAIKAGFKLAAAVEKENRILDSHKTNFPNTGHICADVSELTGKSLSTLARLDNSELAGIIGGPPCQGFSTIGKRCLLDERNTLFSSFFKLISQLRPAFFVAENVPGILHENYNSLRQAAFKTVSKNYQVLNPIKISANEFGAATTRTRIFFIGVRKDISGADRVHNAIEDLKVRKPVFVVDALRALPIKISDSWITHESSWRRLDGPLTSSYLKALNGLIDDVGDPKSITRFYKYREVSSCFGTRHSSEVAKRYEALKPGEQDQISKSLKLRENGYCPTLRAGTDSSKGSFQAVRPIHYSENRVITPREAARLQGFPDWFQFHETKWHSFRQIGNSVCPIVAEKVLRAVKDSLNM